jgi:hypothetical protein
MNFSVKFEKYVVSAVLIIFGIGNESAVLGGVIAVYIDSVNSEIVGITVF